MENKIIDGMIDGRESELNENKVRVVKDYSAIVKDMRIVPVKTIKFTFYQVQVNLGIETIKMRCDEDLVRYINVCAKLNKQGIAKKELVREINESKEVASSFVCVKITLTNGKVFRYFVSRADESTIDVIFEDYLSKQKPTK